MNEIIDFIIKGLLILAAVSSGAMAEHLHKSGLESKGIIVYFCGFAIGLLACLI